MRPRWALRYLTRLGISMAMSAVLASPFGGHFLGWQHLALEDPDFHADGAVGRVSLGQSVVDVGTDRVQRYPPVPVPLPARDLGAAQAAGTGDPDPVGPEPQRRGDRLLHRAAERHALLQLQGHILGHELGVQLRMDHFLDVEVDLLVRPGLDLVLQLLDLGTLAADDDSGPGREDRDAAGAGLAVDVDPRNACMVERGLDEPPNLVVL